MTTTRHYKWDDASAPTLNGTNGSLITVLDACLVNGYGSKPGAGWTKEYYDAGQNIAVYKQGTGSRGCYLRVEDGNTTRATTWWSQDARSASVQAYATCTGTVYNNTLSNEPFNNMPTVSYYLHWIKSYWLDTSVIHWEIFATERCVYLISGYSTESYRSMNFFGDYVCTVSGFLYNTMLTGCPQVTNSYLYSYSDNRHCISKNTTGKYVRRDWMQDVGYYSAAFYSSVGDYIGYNTSLTYPDPLTGDLLFDKVRISITSAPMGYMPGIYEPFHRQPLTDGTEFTSTSPTTSGTTFRAVTLYTGQVLFDLTNDWYA